MSSQHGGGDPARWVRHASAHEEPELFEPELFEPELLEADARGRLVPVLATGGSARGGVLGISLPGAIVGSFVVAALAFGAAGMRPLAVSPGPALPDPVTAPPAVIAGNDDVAPTEGAGGSSTSTDKPSAGQVGSAHEPGGSLGSDPGATTKPTPDASKTPGTIEKLELAGKAKDGKAWLDWSPCSPVGFVAWKLVRSPDESITWPANHNDSLVAASTDLETTAAWDPDPALGKLRYYRVFGLAKRDGVTVAACASRVIGLTVPEPETAPTPKATPKPTPTATLKPAPDGDALELVLAVKDGLVFIDWTACSNTGFAYYKVVRSTDATVAFPAGSGDTVIAAIGDPAKTAAWDKRAPAGTRIYYRVFCVGTSGDGYAILASSPVKAITTPEPKPAPDPVTMGFSATRTETGVQLAWTPCACDGFVFYKVVRSAGPNPSYFPWTEGTEVIAVLDSIGANAFLDTKVASGQTWFYRIQAIGSWAGSKVLLGQTPVREMVIE
jgi:hypothetical protein